LRVADYSVLLLCELDFSFMKTLMYTTDFVVSR